VESVPDEEAREITEALDNAPENSGENSGGDREGSEKLEVVELVVNEALVIGKAYHIKHKDGEKSHFVPIDRFKNGNYKVMQMRAMHPKSRGSKPVSGTLWHPPSPNVEETPENEITSKIRPHVKKESLDLDSISDSLREKLGIDELAKGIKNLQSKINEQSNSRQSTEARTPAMATAAFNLRKSIEEFKNNI
jgi:hypothetical protein